MREPRRDASRHLASEAISASWLGSRIGIEPERLDVLRRRGKLFGIRPPGGTEYLYPAWQFGADGKPLAFLPRLIEAARAANVDDDRLYELMSTRAGLLDHRRLADVLREGGEEHVIAAIRAAGR